MHENRQNKNDNGRNDFDCQIADWRWAGAIDKRRALPVEPTGGRCHAQHHGDDLMPRVNPDILTWARETAGYTSLIDAAKAIQLNDTKKKSGAERLERLERGDDEPSRALLRRMAEKYRRPLITFYLKERPTAGKRGEDFRRAADAPSLDYDPQLDALIRNVRIRHDLVKSLVEDEETPPLAFVGSRNLRSGTNVVARDIVENIAFDIKQFRGTHKGNPADGVSQNGFGYLRHCLEQVGMFVILLGDLGSHHSKIDGRIFRGYAIADTLAPFIVINDNDSQAAWSFTALHEACHIWLGQTGLSGASHDAGAERFCNDVAGRILLPESDVLAMAGLALMDFNEQLGEISQAADKFKVSRRMVAYQLLRNETIDGARYAQLVKRFHEDWLRSRTRTRDARSEGRGPNAHVVKRHRLGPALVNLARRSVESGVLSPTKASRLLGVKTGSLHSLLDSKPV